MIAPIQTIEGTTITGVMRSKRLGMTAEGVGHIATVLQDTLYTDKILAPIREYSTNAMDAHVEAGKPSRPILIRLPNRFSPMFAVRDFGPGMDEHRVWDVFCNYGSSTKRTTNDQVGMLGIGSKSAFAYPSCKAFTVISIQNGVKKSFVCHKGGCSEGDFVQLSEETTTEEDGLEIQIPVSVSDIQEFINRSAKFFAHWEVTPQFEGATIELKKADILFGGANWYIARNTDHYGSSKHAKLLMGNIAYKIGEITTMKPDDYGISSDEQYAFRRLLDTELVLKAPIGSVDIAANREALQMTDKTIAKLWELLKQVKAEIGTELEKGFNAIPTMWEKMNHRAKFDSYDSELRTFVSFLPAHLSSIKTAYGIDSDNSSFTVTTFTRGRRGKRRVRSTGYFPYSLRPSDRDCVVINSNPSVFNNSHVRNRIVALIEKPDNYFKKTFNTVYVFNIKDKAAFTVWKVKELFDYPAVDVSVLPIVKMSEIYPSMRKPSVRSVNADKNSKKFLLLDLKASADQHSDYFVAGTVPKYPTDKIPYLVIDRYQVSVGQREESPEDVINTLERLVNHHNVTLPKNIVAVKKGSVLRIENDKNYISLWKYIGNQLKKNKEFVARMVAINIRDRFGCFQGSHGHRHISFNNNSESIDSRIFSANKASDFDSNKLFYKLITQFGELMAKSGIKTDSDSINNSDCIVEEICKAVGLDKTITDDYEKLSSGFLSNLDKFNDTYPMIELLDSYRLGYTGKPAVIDTINNYIKLVDANTK
jgi:hypothetical protein